MFAISPLLSGWEGVLPDTAWGLLGARVRSISRRGTAPAAAARWHLTTLPEIESALTPVAPLDTRPPVSGMRRALPR